MKNHVNRPDAPSKKISSKDEFELCYLRHKYLRRVDWNPSEAEMAPFMGVVKNLARNTYFTYKNLFFLVGLECEDIINIGTVHLVSYLGLFSIDEKMPEKYAQFVYAYGKKNKTDMYPSEEDLLNKNKANLTLFLKQRMEDLVRICRQKGRNIKGMTTDEYQAFVGPQEPPQALASLMTLHEELGFKKLDWGAFKSLRKRLAVGNTMLFKLNSLFYVAVALEKKPLSDEDLSGADLDPHDNIHNMNPEQVLFNNEERMYWDKKQTYMDQRPKYKRKKLLKFIEENKESPDLKEELALARKILKNEGIDV